MSLHKWSVLDVVRALGGVTAAADVCGVSEQSIRIAIRVDRFSMAWHLPLQKACRESGLNVANFDDLFGQMWSKR